LNLTGLNLSGHPREADFGSVYGAPNELFKVPMALALIRQGIRQWFKSSNRFCRPILPRLAAHSSRTFPFAVMFIANDEVDPARTGADPARKQPVA